MIWAKETKKVLPRHDLNKFWFYIDEKSREIPKVKGPVSRQELKMMVDDGALLRGDSYVWHPVFGHKWTLVEKSYDILSPKSSISENSIHEACQRRLQLLNYPYPHLKGTLEINIKNKAQKK